MDWVNHEATAFEDAVFYTPPSCAKRIEPLELNIGRRIDALYIKDQFCICFVFLILYIFFFSCFISKKQIKKQNKVGSVHKLLTLTMKEK